MKKETKDNFREVIGIPIIFLVVLFFVVLYSAVAIFIFGTIIEFLE